MKRIALALMLISPFSFAVVGDVYFCSTIKDIQINKDGSLVKRETVAFKFKHNDDVMDFGPTNFIDTSLPYKITSRIAGDFHAETHFSKAYFSEDRDIGQLFWSTSNPNYVRSFVADCDKF